MGNRPGEIQDRRPVRLQPVSLSTVIGYTVAAITSTLGVLVLFGMFLPETAPNQVRMTFGVVLVLLGVYRFAITRVRVMQSRRDFDE
jgi:inner membrane protein involved in colicin E2 resistance